MRRWVYTQYIKMSTSQTISEVLLKYAFGYVGYIYNIATAIILSLIWCENNNLQLMTLLLRLMKYVYPLSSVLVQ